MSKRRKTRQQKMVADLRRQVASSSLTQPISIQHTPSLHIEKHESSRSISIPTTSYKPTSQSTLIDSRILKRDLYKTTLLSGTLLLVEVFLYFLLKSHILKLPFIAY